MENMFPIIPNRIGGNNNNNNSGVVVNSGSNNSALVTPYHRSDKNIWSVWNSAVIGCNKINSRKDTVKVSSKLCRSTAKNVTINETTVNSLDADQKYRNGSVYASTFIPKGTVSIPINRIHFITIQQAYEKCQQINLTVNNKGTLLANNNDGKIISENVWLPMISLSYDVHSNNVIIEITAAKEIRLRITHDIEQRQELLLWFSEETLAFMSIPFLTPTNIRGK